MPHFRGSSLADGGTLARRQAAAAVEGWTRVVAVDGDLWQSSQCSGGRTQGLVIDWLLAQS
jgi:hypothetical protein